MPILLTPASWFQIPRVGVSPEVVAFWVTIEMEPHPITLDLTGKESKRACYFIEKSCKWSESAQHSYLCDAKHTEERGMTGVQPLQLHPHLKTIPALRKRLVLPEKHGP